MAPSHQTRQAYCTGTPAAAPTPLVPHRCRQRCFAPGSGRGPASREYTSTFMGGKLRTSDAVDRALVAFIAFAGIAIAGASG